MTDQIAKGSIQLGDDFSQHRITGYVHQAVARGLGDGYIDVPLVSHVQGNLYQGGCMHGVALPEGFKHVVSLYPWEQYVLPEGCDRLEVKMYDSLGQACEQVEEIADKVIEFLEDGPTLVHCQAGMNRSGLVAARVLMKQGVPAGDAIALLRRRSHCVLSNAAFEAYLVGLED